ncbi:hypothetical protein niasHT_014154 [Heterodera trifolii]|uniref:RING-type domain-containing protein n=1 Tax=Heterodera trifolii TaxID=157864 RepID=A0ABD2KWW2_9BILA
MMNFNCLFILAFAALVVLIQQNVAKKPLLKLLGLSAGSSSKSKDASGDGTSNEEECPKMACNVCFDDIEIDQLCFCDGDQSTKTVNERKDDEKSHAICIECLRRYTKAAYSTMPFADGGIGLSCVEPNCQNPIGWDTLKKRLTGDSKDKKTIKSINGRMEEKFMKLLHIDSKDKKTIKSINGLIEYSALLIFAKSRCIERCPKCDYAVDMRMKQQEKHMKCPSCNYEMCRECEIEKHGNLSCLEFAKRHNRLEHLMQKHLDDVAIDKCPKCHLKFIKDARGCNYVNHFF